MSFTSVRSPVTRLNRSQLFVPCSSPHFFAKAAHGPADVISLDLEDAVAPDDKPAARANAIAALNGDVFGAKTVSVRINGLDTHYCYRDVVDVMEQGGERLDLMMIPKVGTAADVYAIDMLVTQIEAATGRKKKLGLEVIIETAMGLKNVDAIAAASPRLEALHFGAADFAASMGMRTTNIGGPNPDYGILLDPDDTGLRDFHWQDLWHYPMVRMIVAARANGLRPVDGPFGDYSDPDGYSAQGRRSAILGCEGKWAIHPSQVALANTLYTPPAADVKRAKRILKEMKASQKAGAGAVSLDGRLIDAASIKQANVIVNTAREIARQQKTKREIARQQKTAPRR